MSETQMSGLVAEVSGMSYSEREDWACSMAFHMSSGDIQDVLSACECDE